MRTWTDVAEDSLRTGTIAGVATTIAIAACGQAEERNAVAPLNAISHILWGDRAASQDDVSAEYTLTGLALNGAAVISWAALFEMLFGGKAKQGDMAMSLLGGAATAALAYVVDYYVVPERLTPGFEKRLSDRSLLAIYAVLALSLGVGGLLKGRSD
jgi:hypothetical protein